MMPAEPILILVVTAAIAAAVTAGDGQYPSSRKWCSDIHADSKFTFSASFTCSSVFL
jgi:hypothetical protein